VDLVAAVVADEQSLEVMQPGEGALDDSADAAEARAVVGLPASDVGGDPASAELAPVLVVVVAAVGDQPLGPAPWPADLAAHGRDPLDQRHELGDIVAIAAGDRPGERDPGRVYEEVMLGAVSGSINWARARRGAPLSVRRPPVNGDRLTG
jgi:hypothetical protein